MNSRIKSLLYLLVGVGGMALLAGVMFWVARSQSGGRIEAIWAAYREDAPYAGLTIRYPLDGTLFPPEIVPPTFQWQESQAGADT